MECRQYTNKQTKNTKRIVNENDKVEDDHGNLRFFKRFSSFRIRPRSPSAFLSTELLPVKLPTLKMKARFGVEFVVKGLRLEVIVVMEVDVNVVDDKEEVVAVGSTKCVSEFECDKVDAWSLYSSEFAGICRLFICSFIDKIDESTLSSWRPATAAVEAVLLNKSINCN